MASGDSTAMTARVPHVVTLVSIEDDARDERLRVVWELERGAVAHDQHALPSPADGFDDPAQLDAFLDAVRWGAIASADKTVLQTPFRSGIQIEDYQLDPVVRALSMPRTNLLIADDVGLGKTIEAGLVMQELMLRHRARTMLIVCPARFVLACGRGHLDDFPWLYFVHGGAEPGEGHTLRLAERGTAGTRRTDRGMLVRRAQFDGARVRPRGVETAARLPGPQPAPGDLRRVRHRNPHARPRRHQWLVRDAVARLQPAPGRKRGRPAGGREWKAASTCCPRSPRHFPHCADPRWLPWRSETSCSATRPGLLGNPTRDQGRMMALATVTTGVSDLPEPVVFGERRFTSGCSLDIRGVAPFRTGVELRPLVPDLHVFPDARSWSVHLRRPLVALDEHDATLLKRHLAPLLEPPSHHLNDYQQFAEKRRS